MDLSSPVYRAAQDRLRARFGVRVDPWWEGLPDRLGRLEARWELVIDDPVGRGNTSLVIRCRVGDDRNAVVKLTPEADLTRAEARALRSWSASGRVPRLLDADPAEGALLLEAIERETPVAELGIAVDLDDVADLIAALHDGGDPVVGDGIVTLADRVEFMFDHWAERHGDGIDARNVVSPDRVRRGRRLARRLAREDREPVLLHGDLHPYNVLDGGATRGLVAIDPRPCVGDRAFDTVDWVFWPKDDSGLWEPRCTRLATSLGLDPDRIWDWCRTFAAMLAATTAARGGPSDRVDAFLELAP